MVVVPWSWMSVINYSLPFSFYGNIIFCLLIIIFYLLIHQDYYGLVLIVSSFSLPMVLPIPMVSNSTSLWMTPMSKSSLSPQVLSSISTRLCHCTSNSRRRKWDSFCLSHKLGFSSTFSFYLFLAIWLCLLPKLETLEWYLSLLSLSLVVYLVTESYGFLFSWLLSTKQRFPFYKSILRNLDIVRAATYLGRGLPLPVLGNEPWIV